MEKSVHGQIDLHRFTGPPILLQFTSVIGSAPSLIQKCICSPIHINRHHINTNHTTRYYHITIPTIHLFMRLGRLEKVLQCMPKRIEIGKDQATYSHTSSLSNHTRRKRSNPATVGISKWKQDLSRYRLSMRTNSGVIGKRKTERGRQWRSDAERIGEKTVFPQEEPGRTPTTQLRLHTGIALATMVINIFTIISVPHGFTTPTLRIILHTLELVDIFGKQRNM